MNRRSLLALAAIAIIIAAACSIVEATHGVFAATIDEPLHIPAGYDWLAGEPYTWDIEHPPLTRIAVAAPFVLRGVPKPPKEGWWTRGMFLLEEGGLDQYMPRLQAARRANLPFFALAVAGVAAWAWRRTGPLGAVIAALLFSTLPAVLAHAGMATTDIGGTAFLPWALLALEWFLDRPTAPRAALLGLVAGLGVIAKYSFIPWFGVTAVMLVIERRFRPTRTLLVAPAVAFLVIWGIFRFEVGTLEKSYPRGMELVEQLSPWHLRPVTAAAAKHVVLPAPVFFHGLADVALHNRRGHVTNYLFGERTLAGWWYYFSIALAVKTPVAFLLLFGAGFVLAIKRREWTLPAMFAAMLFITFDVNINIGVRHVIPMYVPMALLAADAVVRARSLWRVPAAALAAVGIGVSLAAHPDYLPWFNVLAGREPSRVLADSNFDWGQDTRRLARACAELGVEELVITFMAMEPTLPPTRPPRREERLRDQWIAFTGPSIVVMRDKGFAMVDDLDRATRRYQVGKTMKLFYIPQ